MKIYNSLTGKKEKAGRPRPLGTYVCGVTPYDVTHLGHAFTYIFFDVLIRYLKFKNFKITYVQNVTDIDDDIVKRSKRDNVNWKKLGNINLKKYLRDMKTLNNARPDIMPRASENIKEIITIVKALVTKGLAYEGDGNVYFSVDRYKKFGQLSRIPKNKMLAIANQRGNFPDDPNKNDPLDFVLWQAKKEKHEPSWNSPWGYGRPGWHIECSAMSMKHTGKTIDIHGGGSDLIFPHHEAEIAQSENYTGKKFVRLWMHVAMLKYRGEKMSKSKGNLILVSDLLRKYTSNAIRIMLLSNHYRKQWEYKENRLKAASKTDKLFSKAHATLSRGKKNLSFASHRKRFYESLDNDIGTPAAFEALKRLCRTVIRSKGTDIGKAKAFLGEAFNILGLVYRWKR
ncbi:MAG: cysteine--tRNA ligase [Candidatus Aenigmarchaeota archaeon]|nr:cysteine--tRNA ligase [Candidatus Aenigmarchaeota archaeon]